MILVINTSTRQFCVGIVSKTGALISEYILSPNKGGSSYLMPAISFLIKHSCKDLKEISCVAVTIGPGSFTGLKVGLSVAKGICFSLNIPIIGVSSLEALAIGLPYTELPITAIIDSRKREYFFAQFRHEKGRLVKIKGDSYLKIEEFPSLFSKDCIFVGNDYETQASLIKEYMGDDVILAPSNFWHIRAANIGAIAVNRLKESDTDDFVVLEPVYLRAPEIRKNPYRLIN